MRPIYSIYQTTAGTTVRVARTNKDSESTNKQIRFRILLIHKHIDWLRGGINKCSLNVFWYKFYLKKEAKHWVDSFVHVFRNLSESNWKFSPDVRFGASLSLWCVNAIIPVIVICKFLTKEYLSKISGVCQFSPFCVLYVVRYNKTNMTSLCGVQQE